MVAAFNFFGTLYIPNYTSSLQKGRNHSIASILPANNMCSRSYRSTNVEKIVNKIPAVKRNHFVP